jgi:hypothetical protein
MPRAWIREMSSKPFEDIGFVAEATVASEQPQGLKHRWVLIAEADGVSRHRCLTCGAIRTRTRNPQSGRLPTTRYLLLGKTYDAAPPCKSRFAATILRVATGDFSGN